MINAIHARKQWRKANTAVHIGYAGTMLDHYKDAYMSVYLHGHQIARYFYNDGMRLEINHQGWKTNTTKSRLNALIKFVLGDMSGIYQKNFNWFIKQVDNATGTYDEYEINGGWYLV